MCQTVANTSNEPGINNNETARLRGNDSGRQIGPGKLLEVMPGDVIDMETSFYHQGTYNDDGAVSSAPFLSNLLTLMNGAAAVASESQAVSDAVNLNSGDIFAGANGSNQAPRAYLNYILFDRDFGYLDASYIQVDGTSGQHGTISLSQNISENGYIYVYVSNESNNSFDVYFDDLKIIHQKGKILQEDHYYPFGLSINALSSSAPLSKPNHYKYNGKELQTDFNLSLYDYGSRFYDPQIGRWTVIDPETERGPQFSPYNYTFNNPIRYIDPDGNWPWENKTVRTARRFARKIGGSAQRIKRKDRKLYGGAKVVVRLHGTTTYDNLSRAYRKEVYPDSYDKLDPVEANDIGYVFFKEGYDYHGLFDIVQMEANGGAVALETVTILEGLNVIVVAESIAQSGGAEINIDYLLDMVILQMGHKRKKQSGGSKKRTRGKHQKGERRGRTDLDKKRNHPNWQPRRGGGGKRGGKRGGGKKGKSGVAPVIDGRKTHDVGN